MTSHSVFGRHIYAIGGNLQAATLSGVKVKAVTFWIFVNMGVLAALAGVIFAGRLNQAGPTAGNAFELDAIAAAFIGGAAVQGGVGKVVGAITGGLIMGVINNGMSLIGAPERARDARQGPGAARRRRLRRLDQATRLKPHHPEGRQQRCCYPCAISASLWP